MAPGHRLFRWSLPHWRWRVAARPEWHCPLRGRVQSLGSHALLEWVQWCLLGRLWGGAVGRNLVLPLSSLITLGGLLHLQQRPQPSLRGTSCHSSWTQCLPPVGQGPQSICFVCTLGGALCPEGRQGRQDLGCLAGDRAAAGASRTPWW
jgi:hypothetical protein